MESRSDITVNKNIASDNNIVYYSAVVFAYRAQTDSTEIIKMTENYERRRYTGRR
jgi:hypothetical protein